MSSACVQVEDAGNDLASRLDMTNNSTSEQDSEQPSLSDERREHLLKSGERKVPWNQSDISYYNTVSYTQTKVLIYRVIIVLFQVSQFLN